MTDNYIDSHFVEIKKNACAIESRLDDCNCTIDSLKEDNRTVIKGFKRYGEQIALLDNDYKRMIDDILYQ
jgi:hypothetical protein